MATKSFIFIANKKKVNKLLSEIKYQIEVDKFLFF